MKFKYIFCFLLLCSCDVEKTNAPVTPASTIISTPSSSPSVIIPTPSSSPSATAIVSTDYTLNENTKQIFKNLTTEIGKEQISATHIDDKGNILLMSLSGTAYHFSKFNSLTKYEPKEKNFSRDDISSLKVDENGNGYAVFRNPLTITPSSIPVDNSDKEMLIKIKNFKPEETKFFIDYPSDTASYSDIDSGKGFYTLFDINVNPDYSINMIKINEISNFTEIKLLKEIKPLDENLKIKNYILDNKNKNAILLAKNQETKNYTFLKLENNKLEIIGISKNNNISENSFSGKIDANGNGYVYWKSNSNEISLSRLKNYNLDINTAKLLKVNENVPVSSNRDNYFTHSLELDENGNGFLVYYIYPKLFYLKINNYVLDETPNNLATTNPMYNLLNINVSINVFGDGLISWNEYLKAPEFRLIKHYDLFQ